MDGYDPGTEGGQALKSEKTALELAFRSAGACAWGCLRWEEIAPHMEPAGRERVAERCPQVRSLLCAAFPYASGGERAERISRYAWGEDYHTALRRRLEQAAEALKQNGMADSYACWADVSPFPEVYAAARAGLGKRGRNGLLITKEAGSYVFLGFVTTDGDFPSTAGEIEPCMGCGACIRACPGGALREEGVFPERCLSALTQKRGLLTPSQEALVQKGGLIWGCDRCQTCCPENPGRGAAPLPEFDREEPRLSPEDLALGDKAFRKKYAGKAFVWRGVQPLRRNAALLNEEQEHPKGD